MIKMIDVFTVINKQICFKSKAVTSNAYSRFEGLIFDPENSFILFSLQLDFLQGGYHHFSCFES